MTMSQTIASAQVTEASPTTETDASSAKEHTPARAPVPKKELVTSRTFSFRDASIEHVLKPGGVLHRYVVLDSRRLRDILGQPKRREIEPLHAKQKNFELWTSELWELAEREAMDSLRLLYESAHKIEQDRAAEAPARITAPGTSGSVLKPTLREDHAVGILVQILPNGIDVLQDNGEVRRIVDLDITRALEVSGARVTDRIRVIPTGQHTVTINEERSGSHGDGRRTLRKGRKTYDIVREAESLELLPRPHEVVPPLSKHRPNSQEAMTSRRGRQRPVG